MEGEQILVKRFMQGKTKKKICS